MNPFSRREARQGKGYYSLEFPYLKQSLLHLCGCCLPMHNSNEVWIAARTYFLMGENDCYDIKSIWNWRTRFLKGSSCIGIQLCNWKQIVSWCYLQGFSFSYATKDYVETYKVSTYFYMVHLQCSIVRSMAQD